MALVGGRQQLRGFLLLARFTLRDGQLNRRVQAPAHLALYARLNHRRVLRARLHRHRNGPGEGMHQDRRGQQRRGEESQLGRRTPQRLPPARLKDLVGDKADALRDFFVPQHAQRFARQAQPRQFLAAGFARGGMGFDGPAIVVPQFAEQIRFQID